MTRSRTGFTLVELLVVIAIVAVLIGLLLPAVQKVRAAAARVQCANNLKQIGLALQQYHAQYRHFPVGMEDFEQGHVANYYGRSWHTHLLPYLEQQALWAEAERDWNLLKPGRWAATVLPAFGCPADGRTRSAYQVPNGGPRLGLTSYLGVSGTNLWRRDGVLFRGSRVAVSDITDGTSNTLAVGERPPYPDAEWGVRSIGSRGQWLTGSGAILLGVRELYVSGGPINPPGEPWFTGFTGAAHFRPGSLRSPADAYHFWSLHPGGAHFAFADGSARFLSYSADSVLPALATRGHRGRATVAAYRNKERRPMAEQPPVPDALAETVRAMADLIWHFHPNRVLAYYLCGSRATGTARAGSDVDLLVVLREGVSQDATEDIQTLLFLCARIAGLPLDLAFLPEDEAREYGTAFLPPEGVFLAGTDVRAGFGSPPPDALTAALMNTAFQIIEGAYPPGKMLPYPLPPPDPKDPWLGYVPESQGPQHAVLKPLFKVVMAVVQAMLARHLAVWVRPTHAQIAESYRSVYGEEWVGLIEGMFRPCRSEWHFFIPAGEADRARLRDLCHQALAFVNHFQPFYRQFLLQELRCDNAERRRVARRLITRTPAIRLQDPSPIGHSASP